MPSDGPVPSHPDGPGVTPLVLASGSAARAALLRAAGVPFRVAVSAVDETALKTAGRKTGAAVETVALSLARAKAHAGAEAAGPAALVLGADQMLDCGGTWFDKPPDAGAARRQLLALRGRTHRLVTAAVGLRDGVEVFCTVATPVLTMRAFGASFLDAYLQAEGVAILGCVGAYRLEGPGMQLFDLVEGEHAAVVGLPLLAVLDWLRKEGVLLA